MAARPRQAGGGQAHAPQRVERYDGEGLNGLDAEEGVVFGLLQQRLARQAQTARAAGSSGARPQRLAA